MSHTPYHEKQIEDNPFKDQMDLIIKKKTVIINQSTLAGNTSLESTLGKLSQLLQSLEPAVFLEKLHIIDLKLSSLPTEVILLFSSKLRVLDLRNNHLLSFPSNLNLCPNLESLNLAQNSIKILRRKEILWVLSLKYLLLKDNQLTYIPPALADFTSLESLILSGNPLVLPPAEFCEKNSNNICELQLYLSKNRVLLDQHIESQGQIPSKAVAPSTPRFARTRSMSDTRTKSLKASRRMGLIINSSIITPEGVSVSAGAQSFDSTTPSKPERKLLLPLSSKLESFEDICDRDSTSHFEFPRNTEDIPSQLTLVEVCDFQESLKCTDIPRTRSSTYKDESIYETGDPMDVEPKLSTFSRRLSTLQERPSDEFSKAHMGRNISELGQIDEKKQVHNRFSGFEFSPYKGTKKPASSEIQPSHDLLVSHSPSVLIEVTKKILFCMREVYGCCERLASESDSLSEPFSHPSIDSSTTLEESLEKFQVNDENSRPLISALAASVVSFKSLILTFGEYLRSFVNRLQLCQLRAIYMSFFGALLEVRNVFMLTNGDPTSFRTQHGEKNLGLLNSQQTANKSKQLLQASIKDLPLDGDVVSIDIDVRLLNAVEYSTSDALVVLNELIHTLNALLDPNSKSLQNLGGSLLMRCKELHIVCSSTMNITRRLTTNLINFRMLQSMQTRKYLWDDINSFLKAILQIFAAVKSIMNDTPVLNEVRSSMANLTRSTKELTKLLEASSFKNTADTSHSSLNSTLIQLGGSLASRMQLPGPVLNPPLNTQVITDSIATSGTLSQPTFASTLACGAFPSHENARSSTGLTSFPLTTTAMANLANFPKANEFFHFVNQGLSSELEQSSHS